MINDRDIFREIVEEHKNPKKTLAKDLSYTPLIIFARGRINDYSHEAYGGKGLKRAAMVKNGNSRYVTEDIAKRAASNAKLKLSLIFNFQPNANS